MKNHRVLISLWGNRKGVDALVLETCRRGGLRIAGFVPTSDVICVGTFDAKIDVADLKRAVAYRRELKVIARKSAQELKRYF